MTKKQQTNKQEKRLKVTWLSINYSKTLVICDFKKINKRDFNKINLQLNSFHWINYIY